MSGQDDAIEGNAAPAIPKRAHSFASLSPKTLNTMAMDVRRQAAFVPVPDWIKTNEHTKAVSPRLGG